jgi:hypothetical protein
MPLEGRFSEASISRAIIESYHQKLALQIESATSSSLALGPRGALPLFSSPRRAKASPSSKNV